MQVEGLRERLDEVRSGIGEALQMSPVRALSVSVGQIAQTAIGGRAGILERSRKAQAAAGSAEREVTALEARRRAVSELLLQRRDIQANVRGLPPAEKAAAAALNRTEVRQAIAAQRYQQPYAERAVTRAGEAQGAILTRSQTLRAQGVGVAGIVGGTLLFGAAMQAAQVGLELFSKAITPAMEGLVNFAGVSNRVVGELVATFRQAGGDRGAAAKQAGMLGMNADTWDRIGGTITDRVAVQAGNENLREQIEMLRTFQNLRAGRGGAVPGISSGTGGVLGSSLLATPGTIEQVAGMVLPSSAEMGVNTVFSMARDPLGTLGALGGGTPGQQLGVVAPNADLSDLPNTMKFVNDQARKAGEGFGQLTAAISPEELEAYQQTLRDLQVPEDQIARVSALGVVRGPDGAPTTEATQKFFTGVNIGSQTPTPGLMLASMQRQITAQMRGIERQTAFTQGTVLPAQFGLQQLAAGVASGPTQGIVAPGQDTPASVAAYTAQITQARTEVAALRAEGIATLERLGVPPEQIQSVMDLGQEIRELSEASENAQLGLELFQYNRQLFIAKRTVGDMLGLQGKLNASVDGTTVAATKYGQLQREQMLDQREMATIQLARSRREIEFGLAMSRLTTPGATPGQRAALAHEAELRAAEALRIQDLQEETTFRGFDIEDIGITRQAQDAIHALRDLEMSRGVQLEVRGIERVIDAKQQLLGLAMQMANSSVDAGVQMKQIVLNTQTEIEAATGVFLDEFATEIDEALGMIASKYGILLGDMAGFGAGKGSGGSWDTPGVGAGDTAPTGDTAPPGGGFGGGKGGGGSYAGGIMGDTRGMTQMTVGEANGEKVIVLRNPRDLGLNELARMAAPSEGQSIMRMEAMPRSPNPLVRSLEMPGFATVASGDVTVNFNAPVNVRSDADLDEISRRVEAAVNRRAAMLGVSG
jgi:hypothetical protein